MGWGRQPPNREIWGREPPKIRRGVLGAAAPKGGSPFKGFVKNPFFPALSWTTNRHEMINKKKERPMSSTLVEHNPKLDNQWSKLLL